MCGIAGYRYMDGRLAKGDSDITSMLEKIDHRGPDESGFYNYGPVSIGNTRLSIIGLDNGHQPITNEDGSVVVVFNGEIYNYPTLKKDLQSKGHIFKTSTDTEVLVHLYEEEGIGFLNRLNGMFTLALLDKTNNKLFVARDRFGVKPLFWMQRNGRFSFASEMKSLKVLAEFDSDLSPEGLSCFLGLFYIPDPWTIFKNVRRLKPGHFLTITDKDIVESEYYDFDFTTKNKHNYK